jgi:acyl-CoA thioester hydrolase
MTAGPRAGYGYVATITTRWKDNDVYGHINNVEYYSYLDTAINLYLIREGGLDIHDGKIVGYIAESHCKFLKSLAYPEVLEVGLRVAKLGNSSVRYELGLFRQGDETPAAEAWIVHVFVDRESNRAHSIPDSIRNALEKLQVSTS